MATASATTYLRDSLLDEILIEVDYTAPTTYLALFTSPTDASGGGTEVTGGSYARVAVASLFSASSGGDSTNTSDISFGAVPTCTVTDIALMDDPTTGNMLMHMALDFPLVCTAGDTPTFGAGTLTISNR